MKFTEDLLIHYLHSSIVLLGTIVFFDVLIRFKSPLKQKIYFVLIILFSVIASLFSLIATGPDQFVLAIFTCKTIFGISMIQVFTYLYFISYKKFANTYSIFTVLYLMLLYYFGITNENLFPTRNLMTSLLDQREFEFKLPFFSTSLSYLYLFSSNALFLFYTYTILFKYSHDNQYFKKIKKWTFAMFGLIVYAFFFFLCSLFIDVPNNFYQYASIAVTLYVLLIILYRPNFINKNGHKISFGQAFNRKFKDEIKTEMFEFQFFSNFYFRNKEANINDFANVLGVNKDLLFNYVYYAYSMSFDELVNKNRIDFFVEIIKDPKFKNYTVEALALEVGFTSRQRFYQPFKKYHGGNPSDLIDILND